MLATGGFGRMFRVTSNAWSLTGDGVGARLPPRHPDAGHGVLPVPPDRDRRDRDPAVRGGPRRGRLSCSTARASGSWSATRPTMKDLAPRDMVCRAIYLEVRGGRGIDGKDYVYLDVRHLGPQGHRGEAARHHRLRAGLPGRRADHRARADPADRPLRDGRHPDRRPRPGDPRRGRTVVPGLYAAGEMRLRQRPRREPARDELARRPARVRAPCRPPDGARRQAASGCPELADATSRSRSAPRSTAIRARHEGRERGQRIRDELADVMMDNVGVYRDEAAPAARAAEGRASCSERYAQGRRCTTRGRSSTPTSSRRASSATCSTAPRRPSSPRSPARRAAAPTAREDFPDRDDVNFLTHTPGDPRAGGGSAADLQAGHDHPVPAQAARPTERRRAERMQVDLRILRYDPERDTKPHWESYTVESDPMGPRPRPPPQGQVRAGRVADVPPLVRPRRVRLGRDAHQRPQPARLQDPGRPARQATDHGRAAARAAAS